MAMYSMFHPNVHGIMVVAALGIALGSAAIAKTVTHATTVESVNTVTDIQPFALANLLAKEPADTIVIALDEPRHSLRYSQPASLYGASDESLVQNAPKARHIVLAGFDVVRTDKLAKQMRAKGRDVRILAGGLDAWDTAMDQDPPTPGPAENATVWQTYRQNVALRRAFGDAPPAPVQNVAKPVAPAVAPGGGAPKKREGC